MPKVSLISLTDIFIGTEPSTLDKKNRVMVPVAFRCPTYGTKPFPWHTYILEKKKNEPALVCYFKDAPIYNDEQQSAISPFQKAVQPNDDGRILISEDMKRHLGITMNNQKIVFVACGKYFEIWAAKSWARIKPTREEKAQTVTSQHRAELDSAA